MQYSRKHFLRVLGLGALATTSVACKTSQLSAKGYDAKAKPLFSLGVASYSLRELPLAEALKVANRLQLKAMSLKSMHMPLESSASEIKAIAKTVRDAGIDLYGAGVIYMNTEEEVKNTFAYAQAAGLRMIIGVPKPELLPLVDQQVKATDIKVAIHNHGPGDEVYPSPDTVWEKVKNFDKRIGFCIDVGHTFRIEQDPAAKIRQYADRLYDVHLKDVDKVGGEGDTLEMGRGIMDIPAILNALAEIKYSGVVALEYEKDGKDPVPGLAESVGYTRGILNAGC